MNNVTYICSRGEDWLTKPVDVKIKGDIDAYHKIEQFLIKNGKKNSATGHDMYVYKTEDSIAFSLISFSLASHQRVNFPMGSA